MTIRYALLAAATLGACTAMAASPPSLCPTNIPFPGGLRVIDVVRVVKSADGESDFVDVKLPTASHAYFRPLDLKQGETFAALDFGAANRVQIVSGPPNVKLPLHASLAYEMFLTIQGSSAVLLPNGKRRELRPGSLVIMEDMGSKSGHSGEIGPCGYVSIQIVPSAPPASLKPR